jgi:hypothetical protein
MDAADAVLQGQISSNDTDIATNASGVAANLSAIESNDTDIAANLSAIQSNDTDIATNASGVAANLSAIGSNDTDIAANLSAIQSNDTDITNLQSELDATQTGAGLGADGSYTANATNYAATATSLAGADADLDAALKQEETDRIANDFWNEAAGVLTPDAGVTDVDLTGVDLAVNDIQANDVAASTLYAPNATVSTLQTVNGSVQDLSGQDIAYTNANFTNFTVFGPTSTADIDGTLNVDGATTLSGTTMNGDLDLNGSADISGTLDVTGMITGNLTGNVTGQVSDISNHDTGDLSEGTNLYYTDARSRAAVSVTDAGGDGSLSYDNTTGVITYTGVSAAETRAHFTGGTGVTITAGEVAIGQDVATTADVTFASVNAAISGDLTGDVLSADGQVTVLDGGTDGTDATFTGDVTGDVSGNAGTVTNGVYTTSSVTALSDVTSAGSGSIITGTERTKLNGIETAATADQTDAEIKTAYENNANTNAFEDADETKLDAIEASADVTDATNVEAAGALMDSELADLAGVKAVTISTLQVKPSEGAFADGDKTKLDGLEAGATADMTDAEIKTAYENNANTNAFEDADETKLDGVEASADVTDATNVTAAGALMDSELTDLAGVKAVTISTLQVKPSEGAFVDGDKTKLDGIETAATADQTDAEIKTAYENNANTNAFEDADETKLDGIEALADVTDATNVAAAGAVMNTGDETIAGTKTFSSAIASTVTTGTAPFTVASTTMVANLNADQLDGQEGSYYTDFSNQVVDASEVTNTMVADDLTISGGTINNTPIGQTTAAAGDFTAVNVEGAAVVNELRGTGTVFEVYDSNAGSALTVNADGTTTIQDLSLTNSFNLTGSMTASVFTTTTANPTANNHLTHKAYVDAADATLQANIDAVTGAAEAFSVDATLSAYSTGLTYYLNGSVLMYGTTSTEGAEEYTFTVYGSDLDHATPGKLYFRGSYIDLAGHDWSVAGGTTGPQATFTLSWAEINAWTTATLGYAAPGIESGSMSFDLIIDGKNTGLNLDVELDNTTVTVPVSASFN